MKHRLFPLLFILLACSPSTNEAPSPPAAAEANNQGERQEAAPARCVPTWRELEPGLRYKTAGCSETSEPPRLHLVELVPRIWKLDAVTTEPSMSSDVAEQRNAAFAINTNFFDEQQKTLGLVVSGGKTISPLHPVSWQSVFYVTSGGDVGIAPQEEWESSRRNVAAAVQCGPRLMIDGKKNEVAKGEPSLRSGVCITPEKKLVFFATTHDGYFDVHEMVEMAADPSILNCRDAMLFDGGPSAQLFLDSAIDVVMEGDAVPAHIVARRF